jgi:wyosine [tRNA(Phe)-imidazoG37] synthetase (radical SAM superfamily)
VIDGSMRTLHEEANRTHFKAYGAAEDSGDTRGPEAASNWPSLSRLTSYSVVIPVDGFFHRDELADCARHLIDAAHGHAHQWIDGPVEILGFDPKTRDLWRYSNGQIFEFTPESFAVGGMHVFMNTAFLLSARLPLFELRQRAIEKNVAWCGEKDTCDTHAIAFTADWLTSHASPEPFWAALIHLTACVDDDVDDEWRAIEHQDFVAPNPSGAANSPAMASVSGVWHKRWVDTPRFLNTAFREVITTPQSQILIKGQPALMAEALVEQRKASRVPFIFNALLNDLDHRLGAVEPHSFPLEIHLSLTGKCNIECSFCAYTHKIARSQFVKPEQFANLDFLENVQTLRLNSGLGEPTLNKSFSAIIDYISTRYPHIGINFFTDGAVLHRAGVLNAIVGNVRWLNISLNAATRESWKEQCNADLFDRVIKNVQALYDLKRSNRSLWPLVFGSMVLNRASARDLPLMPALCRELGIDRFTAFPYSGLGYREKYGPEMALAAFREDYDELYAETVRQAEKHAVSIELPPPANEIKTAFGSEIRSFYDFARIESNDWRLGRFLTGLKFDDPPGKYCHFLWRQGSVGSTNNAGHTQDETHYMYPCIGPLSGVDLSRKTPFRFPSTQGFADLWKGELFTHLRRAQHENGLCEVCDVCRQGDMRDPKSFPRLENLVARFSEQHSGITAIAAAEKL